MEDKVADNNIEQTKKALNNINNQIDYNKSKLKTFDEVQENYIKLNKDISKCIDILRQSISGRNVDKLFDSIDDENNKNLIKATDSTLEQREVISKELKEEYKKENEKE